jgi:SAM-dependent methyltransferase
MTPKTYKDNFFNVHLENSISSASEIIPIVLNYFRPKSVIDVGCGIGTWLSVWEKHGVKDIVGVDGDYVNKNELLIKKENFVTADLESGFQIERKFDIVTCLEVAEHISSTSAEKLIKSLCALGNIILFSAAIPGQEGTLHINEQYPSYWLQFFKKNNFVPIDCIRNKIWSNEKVSFWYRQNVILYIKKDCLSNFEELEYEAKKTDENFMDLVNPGYFDYKNQKVITYEKTLESKRSLLLKFIQTIYK